MSIQDIQQNPQDTSNFYLSNIYRTILDPNISSTLPTSPPPFSPPNYAIWVNAFWFLSLVISITCALLATLLQQWARRYLKVTQPRYSPHKRARIRAFFAEGVDKFLLPWAVEALPTMLHLSLFLFFAGLAVFLWNVNLTIFKLVLSWVGLCTALYGCITLLPILRPDTPYHTPLSLPAWHIATGIQLVTFRALQWFSPILRIRSTAYRDLEKRYRRLLMQGMQKTADEIALTSPPDIDTRAFIWTFDSLDEDHELERFFSGLPGFRHSKVVKDPLPDLTSEQQGNLLYTLIGLCDRTSSSDLLPEEVQSRRTVICTKAIDLVDNPQALMQVLDRIISEDQYGRVQSAAIARLVKGWVNGWGGSTVLVEAVVSIVVARAQQRDDLWFVLASNEMGVSEAVLRDYATRGNNLPLLILNYLIRQQFQQSSIIISSILLPNGSVIRPPSWPISEFSKVLEVASKFDVSYALPELQNKFCALWNQIVRKVNPVKRGDGLPVPTDVRRSMKLYILSQICDVYLALHQDTDPALLPLSAFTTDEDPSLRSFRFPLCNTPGHHGLHPGSTPHILRVSDDRVILVPSPSPPLLPNHLDVYMPGLDNNLSSASLSASDSESVLDSATSPDPVTAGVARYIETSRAPTTESLPSTSSVASTYVVPYQINTDAMVHSDASETPASDPSELGLNDITGSYASPILLIELTRTSFAGSYCSILATATVRASPCPTSAPEPGAAATRDEASPEPGSHEVRDDVDLPPVNCAIQANTEAVLVLPPRPPRPLPTATVIAIAGPSLREPDSTHDLPLDIPRAPYCSHGQYDIA